MKALLFVFVSLLLMSSATPKEYTADETYCLVGDAKGWAKIVFKQYIDSTKQMRYYELTMDAEPNHYEIKNVCRFGEEGVVLEGTNYEKPGKFKYEASATNSKIKHQSVKFELHHDLLPCWIKWSDTAVWTTTKQLEIPLANTDSVDFLIQSSNNTISSIAGKFHNSSTIKISKVHQSFRGDVFPALMRVKQGYFHGDTLLFLSNEGKKYVFVKSKV